jgi:Zn-dependent protease with chaperone function
LQVDRSCRRLLSGRGGVTRLFSTHPPTEDRIAKLRELA